MSDLTLDALSLSSWQACKRAFLLHYDYKVLLKRPKNLFDQCLRQGIVAISSGTDPVDAINDARTAFLQAAANPGMDLPPGADPYRLAKDWCAMLETILRSLAKLTLLTLHDPAPIPMNSWATWRVLSHADESGTLHRWITVDSWTMDDLARELHSWRTIGDLAFARVPMMIHVVEIGQQRNGRRASAWARAYRHPTMPALRLRFRRSDGSDLNGWKPYYFADHPDVDANEWVESMWKEGAAQALVHHVNVECPSDAACDRVKADVMHEALRIREVVTDRGMVPWSSYPMARNVCDGWVPCPFQAACYTTQIPDVSTLGLFQSRVRGTVRGNRVAAVASQSGR